MKSPLIRLFISALLVSSISTNCFARNETAQQALNCAAVFSVLSKGYAHDGTLASKFTKVADLFTHIYMQEQVANTPADEQASIQLRNAATLELRHALPARAAYFREDTVICGAWAEGFMSQGEHMQFMLVYPKVVPMQVRATYQTYADQVIQRLAR